MGRAKSYSREAVVEKAMGVFWRNGYKATSISDLVRETERGNAMAEGAETGTALPRRGLPAAITDMGLGDLRVADFLKPTCWPTIDIVPSYANAAFGV